MTNNENNSDQTPKFSLGQVVMTSGIDATIGGRPQGFAWLTQCLTRHMLGDWGNLDAEDVLSNVEAASDDAIASGLRVFSVYDVPEDVAGDEDPNSRIYIITSTEAWDAETPMRATTILWPSEY